LSKSFDFYRSFTQWIGGLSFVYLIITFFYHEKKLAQMKGIIGGGGLETSLFYKINVENYTYTKLSIIYPKIKGTLNE
jgi:trk system potassium uptake protein